MTHSNNITAELIQPMYTKQDLLQLLKGNRKLYAYVVINNDCGVYVKQSKSTWIKIIEGMDDDIKYDIAYTKTTIHIS